MQFPLDRKGLDHYLAQRGARLEWMNPLDFLDKTPSADPTLEKLGWSAGTVARLAKMKGEPPDRIALGFDKSSLDWIKGAYKRHELLEPLYLDYGMMFGKWPNHEGRHRAMQAHFMGIAKVPVVIFGKAPRNSVDRLPGPLEKLPKIEGTGYRVPTGFRERGATAGDLVRFEMNDLRNPLGVDDAVILALDAYRFDDIRWLTKTREEALRYAEDPGDVEEFPIPSGSRIVAEDTDGGLLVLFAGALHP